MFSFPLTLFLIFACMHTYIVGLVEEVVAEDAIDLEDVGVG